MARVLAFFNQKGGVSKTSTALLSVDYFHRRKKKILVIDLDPQASLSRTLIPNYPELVYGNELSLSEFFQGSQRDLHTIVRRERIDILPAKISMSRLPVFDSSELLQLKKDYFKPFIAAYDIVIIDCPPSLNHFSKMGILLAHWVLIPLYLERYSFEGIEDALYTIQSLAEISTDFEGFAAFIARKSERRISLHKSFEESYYEMLKGHILNHSLPDFIGVAERSMNITSIFELYNDQHEKIQKLMQFFKELEDLVKEKS